MQQLITTGAVECPAPSQPELGNTLLFDRALTRINETLLETGGILRGIIWHQGEDDSNGACAPFYEQNLITMVSEFRSRIIEDMRGSDARGPSANIPFVLGTMSKGVDDRGDFSNFSQAKSVVDSVHRNIAGLIPFSEVVLNDDLVPANGFPCGGGSCIHFGAAALREWVRVIMRQLSGLRVMNDLNVHLQGGRRRR